MGGWARGTGHGAPFFDQFITLEDVIGKGFGFRKNATFFLFCSKNDYDRTSAPTDSNRHLSAYV